MQIVMGEKYPTAIQRGNCGRKHGEQGIVSKTSPPCMHLAFVGITAPSVGNAVKVASLHFTFSADVETDTDRVMLACTSRQFGDRSPDAPGHPGVYQPKAGKCVFTRGRQPPEAPPNLTSTPHLGAPSCC